MEPPEVTPRGLVARVDSRPLRNGTPRIFKRLDETRDDSDGRNQRFNSTLVGDSLNHNL
jgi:hypothetical protein